MLFSIQTFACSGLLENRIYIGVRVACVSRTTTATGFLDTPLASSRLLENRKWIKQHHSWCFVWLALSFTAMRNENTNNGYLDTSFASLRITRKPDLYRCSSSLHIENTDSHWFSRYASRKLEATRKPEMNKTTSFMMFCLISIVVYGNV